MAGERTHRKYWCSSSAYRAGKADGRYLYDAADNAGQLFSIDAEYVNRYLGALIEDEDLSRFIL